MKGVTSLILSLCYALTLSPPSYYVYYWPIFPVYWTISDLPAISILSCFVPLCHVTNTFLFHTDFLTCMFHSISFLLMTPLHCTTYTSSSPSFTSLILCILTCYLTAHLHVHS